MKVKVLKIYRDIQLKRYTKIGEILNVTPTRLKELQDRVPTFIELIEEEKVIRTPEDSKPITKKAMPKRK